MLPNRLLLFTITIIFLYACKKEDLSSNTSDLSSSSISKLQKVIAINPDKSSFTTEYVYDSKEMLKSITFSSSDYTWKRVVDIEYDNDERLVKATYKTVNDSNVVVETNISYTYVYDEKRIIKRIPTSFNLNPVENVHVYSYDELGRLISDSTLHLQSSDVEGYSKFYWDANNNIIREDVFGRNGYGTFSLSTYREYEYDNKKNPYLPLPVYYANNLIFTHLSRNNVVISKHGGSLTDYQENNYNQDGLLIKTVIRPTDNPDLGITFEFFYD